MCWSCDHPNATDEDYLTQVVIPAIDRYGWFIQHVGGNGPYPPFAYTVGLTELGRPELLVSGLGQRRTAALVNTIGHQLVHHADCRPLAHGDERRFDGVEPSIEVVDLPRPDAHAFVAVQLYGRAVRAQQLVYTDDRGQWPWARGFRGRQPVLGPRASRAA